MSREYPTRAEIVIVIEEARLLERVALSDVREGELERLDQFGGDFYLLFGEMRGVDTGEVSLEDTVLLKKTQALGKPWIDFLEQNPELIDEIDGTLRDRDVYSNILDIQNAFYRMKDYDSVEAFATQIDPALGIDAIYIPILRRLNASLWRASMEMEKFGINPQQFYT